VIQHVEQCDWTIEALDLRPVLDQLGVKPRKAMHVIYTAVEGRSAGLPLFDSMYLLRRERTLRRLRAARERVERAASPS
jgi:glutamyl-tRNA synthetase